MRASSQQDAERLCKEKICGGADSRCERPYSAGERVGVVAGWALLPAGWLPWQRDAARRKAWVKASRKLFSSPAVPVISARHVSAPKSLRGRKRRLPVRFLDPHDLKPRRT